MGSPPTTPPNRPHNHLPNSIHFYALDRLGESTKPSVPQQERSADPLEERELAGQRRDGRVFAVTWTIAAWKIEIASNVSGMQPAGRRNRGAGRRKNWGQVVVVEEEWIYRSGTTRSCERGRQDNQACRISCSAVRVEHPHPARRKSSAIGKTPHAATCLSGSR